MSDEVVERETTGATERMRRDLEPALRRLMSECADLTGRALCELVGVACEETELERACTRSAHGCAFQGNGAVLWVLDRATARAALGRLNHEAAAVLDQEPARGAMIFAYVWRGNVSLELQRIGAP